MWSVLKTQSGGQEAGGGGPVLGPVCSKFGELEGPWRHGPAAARVGSEPELGEDPAVAHAGGTWLDGAPFLAGKGCF